MSAAAQLRFAADAALAFARPAQLKPDTLDRRRGSSCKMAEREKVRELTDLLLLRRALGRAQPEDCVAWAVECLCRGLDGPNLRILAGLSIRLDRDDVERYFLLALEEVGLADAEASL